MNTGAAMCSVLAVAALAGCGSDGGTNSSAGTATGSDQAMVDSAAVEQGIETSLSTSSVKVSSAKCPNDIPSDPGQTFTCTVTLSNSATGDVTVTQEKGRNNLTYAFKEGSFQIPGSVVDAELEKSLASQGYPDTTVNCPSNIIIKVGTTVTCDVSGGSGLASGKVTFTFTSETGEVGSVTT
jgi:Domain of unknown function (DUF4333)